MKLVMFLSLENFCFSPDCGDFAQTSVHVPSVCNLAPITHAGAKRPSSHLSLSISSPALVLCGLRTVPCLSLLWWVTSVPPHTCAAPRSPQECAGACNRLCRGYWVLRLTETSQPHSALDAEWSSAWGGSPNCGRCQIPTVAPRNHSHTAADTSRRGG